MATKGVLLLAIVLCYLSYHAKVEGARRKLSMKEELEIEKQLKLLKKPAIKSIKTQSGDTYDCVDFYKQPAFDHPLLKNHSYHFQMKPSTSPNKRMTTHPSRLDQLLEIELKAESCPIGTVPIRRTTKEDLIRARLFADSYPSNFGSLDEEKPGQHRAFLRTTTNPDNKKYNGAGALISIYNPSVTASQLSSGQIMIQNGPDIIKVGWTVNPNLYGDTKTRLFTFFEAGTSSCFSTRCPGFVVVNRMISLDTVIQEISKRGGPIYVLKVSIFRYAPTGDWWLAVKDIDIGFWPRRIFTGLKDLATYIEWGGETYSPPSQPGPEMGSGYYPEGTDSDGFCGNITIVDEAQRTLPPVPDDVGPWTYGDSPFYRVVDWEIVPHGGFMSSFGGPGRM